MIQTSEKTMVAEFMRCRALLLGAVAAAWSLTFTPHLLAQESRLPAGTAPQLLGGAEPASGSTTPSEATAALGDREEGSADASLPVVSANPPARPTLEDIRAALSARLLAPSIAKTDLVAIAEFYALRDNRPVWIADGALTPIAQALKERMARADEDGLDPEAYRVKGLAALGEAASADQLAETEVSFSVAVLTYVRHAANGRVDGNRIAKDIEVISKTPDLLAALASIVIAADPVAILEGYNPTHPPYVALRKKLAELRASKAQEIVHPLVPHGPALKVGMADTRVAVLRTRLGLTMSDGDIYDEALADAVRAFQKGSNLKPTGIVNSRTLAALNGEAKAPRISPEAAIISNMERWRWLPRDLGSAHVFVNVPQFKVTVVRDNVPVHEAKVIVGKPGTPTPIFSNTMRFVVFNPSWHVPQSIIENEYLPKLMEDPDYLARRGFVVSYYGDRISVRQPPGDGNALGHIKFMFPNRFSVYLHDTSQRGLFANEVRAFSHGCVRVDQPYKFAEMVMGAQHGWTEDRVRKSVGGGERSVDLAEPLPVHLTYFTAYLDEAGNLKQIKDLYGYDRRVLAALGLLR